MKLSIQLFGGRGQSLGISKRLPNYSKTTINDSKIYDYYLKNGSKHNSDFIDVGYTKNDGELLKKHLLKGLESNEAELSYKEETKYTSAVVYMKLGKTKKKRFKTIWGKNKGDKYFRNISAYRSDK